MCACAPVLMKENDRGRWGEGEKSKRGMQEECVYVCVCGGGGGGGLGEEG